MKNKFLFTIFSLVFVLDVAINVYLSSQGDNTVNLASTTAKSIASAKEYFMVGSSSNNEIEIRTDRPNDRVETKDIPLDKGSSPGENETFRPIELTLPAEEIAWIRRRKKWLGEIYWKSQERDKRNRHWQLSSVDPDRQAYNATTGFLKYQEDTEGPLLDFMIAGHPKTGTTTLVANLAKVAPMKVKDFCTTAPQGLLHYLVDKWPQEPELLEGPTKYLSDKDLWMVGSKCPRFMSDPEMMIRYTPTYPRMKLIIGIRHPIEWFTSFARMGNIGDFYTRLKICPAYERVDPVNGIPGGISRNVKKGPDDEICLDTCRCGIPVCFHRARLHLPLARVGKTPLSLAERELLAPNDPDGGANLFNIQARNPIFVYDQAQMRQDSYWDELAAFLGLSYIPNEHYHGSKGHGSNHTLCVPYYDEFRAMLMEHSFNMSVWLEEYFLPVAMDPNRHDVVVADPTGFRELVRTYRNDPCGRLVRREGTYVLDGSLQDGSQAQIERHSHKVEPCRAVTQGERDRQNQKRRNKEEPAKNKQRGKQPK